MPIEINGALYLSPKEISDYFGVDRNSVTQRIQRGTLPGAFKVGRDWFIPQKELENISFNKKISPKVPSNDEWVAMIRDIQPDVLYTGRAIAIFFNLSATSVAGYAKSGALPAIHEETGKRPVWKIKGQDAINFFAEKYQKKIS